MSEWISVKDRLPEKKDYVYWRTDDLFYVLCYVKSTGKMDLAFKDGKYWQDRHGNRLRYVTHWMSLPEPPKENDEDGTL